MVRSTTDSLKKTGNRVTATVQPRSQLTPAVTRQMDDDPWALEPLELTSSRSGSLDPRLLVRFAILAPSSHNTQPWLFTASDREITVEPDITRWLEVADPTKRELHISLGCAVENIVIAAEHAGCQVHTDLVKTSGGVAVRISWEAAHGLERSLVSSNLAARIPLRRTSHAPFRPTPIATEGAEAMLASAKPFGVRAQLYDDPRTIARVADLTARADEMQFVDRAWRAELSHWLGQGVFGGSWLKARIGSLVVRYADLGKSTGKKNRELMAGSPMVGLISASEDSHEVHIESGRAFQRLALTADSLGIGVQPMSGSLEVPELRSELASSLAGAAAYPLQLFRVGYPASEEEHTPRRQLGEVLTQPSAVS